MTPFNDEGTALRAIRELHGTQLSALRFDKSKRRHAPRALVARRTVILPSDCAVCDSPARDSRPDARNSLSGWPGAFSPGRAEREIRGGFLFLGFAPREATLGAVMKKLSFHQLLIVLAGGGGMARSKEDLGVRPRRRRRLHLCPSSSCSGGARQGRKRRRCRVPTPLL